MTRTTPELASSLQTSTPHQREDAPYTADIQYKRVSNLEPSGSKAETLPLGHRGHEERVGRNEERTGTGKGPEETKDLIRSGKEEMRAHVESQVGEIKDHVNKCVKKMDVREFYRTELKTRRQKPGDSLQVLAADVERLMSLAYAECPLDIRERLDAQYYVDTIKDEDTQLSARLMDLKDLKSALA
ncbi:hypothetical protein AVEN_158904-1 [Araneus ventricosus]|uniref:Uncharacterized protein n=1 Tax=Araneus ventricosus TaxID=182803 RepID=A0A4Y2B8S8_ARAVE|nr:hypothetical protein AVEN_158904-1 [Araneus ventricosus]